MSDPAPKPDQNGGAALPASPLGYKSYRELWSANALSNFGSQIQVVGAAWLMASLTSSPQIIALVQTVTNLPTVLFILLGGALADNFDRRRIMLVTQSAMLCTALVLATLTWTGGITPWLLLGLIFTTQSFGSLNNPSWQASVRDILPRGLISRAVALNSLSINLARTVGPALGGLIVTLLGVGAAFIANALSFVGFLLALLRWRPAERLRPASREPIGSAIAAGMRYAFFDRNVRNAVVRGGLSGFSASAVFALLPVLARQELKTSALVFGILMASFGGGAVISAYTAGQLRARLTPDQVVRIAAGMMTMGLAILGFAPVPVVAAVGAALGGAGWTMAHSTYNTTVQLSAAPWVTARSLAFYQTATFAGMAGGSLVFGWVAEHQGVAVAFLVASGAQAAAALVGLALPLPKLGDLKVELLDTWRAPVLDIEVAGHEGPIRVEIEYRVAPDNWPEFAAAMRVRQRIRRRDGARNWALWQDVTDRTRWIESYRVANWGDYLRHNMRRTEADRENMDTLARLNADPAGPAVRRYIARA